MRIGFRLKPIISMSQSPAPANDKAGKSQCAEGPHNRLGDLVDREIVQINGRAGAGFGVLQTTAGVKIKQVRACRKRDSAAGYIRLVGGVKLIVVETKEAGTRDKIGDGRAVPLTG